jgi:hypothetical protein
MSTQWVKKIISIHKIEKITNRFTSSVKKYKILNKVYGKIKPSKGDLNCFTLWDKFLISSGRQLNTLIPK